MLEQLSNRVSNFGWPISEMNPILNVQKWPFFSKQEQKDSIAVDVLYDLLVTHKNVKVGLCSGKDYSFVTCSKPTRYFLLKKLKYEKDTSRFHFHFEAVGFLFPDGSELPIMKGVKEIFITLNEIYKIKTNNNFKDYEEIIFENNFEIAQYKGLEKLQFYFSASLPLGPKNVIHCNGIEFLQQIKKLIQDEIISPTSGNDLIFTSNIKIKPLF